MKYPNFIKIFDMDEDKEEKDWCARLIKKKSFNEDWYVSEIISYENSLLIYDEYESYRVADLKDSGLKFYKITEQEYIKFISKETKKQLEEEIEDLQEYLSNYTIEINKKIEDLNREILLLGKER